ncbi:MAG: hypothetical protein ACTSVM_03650 [Candidatus Ranarchaeia archaeon]
MSETRIPDYAYVFERVDEGASRKEVALPAWQKYALVADRLQQDGALDGQILTRIAWAYLQGAWAARAADKNSKKTEWCLRWALKYFTEAIKHDTEDHGQSTDLCGEINRLLGSFNLAEKYLRMVSGALGPKDKRKRLVKLSRSQLKAVKAKNSKVMLQI